MPERSAPRSDDSTVPNVMMTQWMGIGNIAILPTGTDIGTSRIFRVAVVRVMTREVAYTDLRGASSRRAERSRRDAPDGGSLHQFVRETRCAGGGNEALSSGHCEVHHP